MSDDEIGHQESELLVGAKRAGRGESRPFPRKTLTDALKVVHAIKEQNAGKPFPPQQVAEAIGRKPRSSDFQVILAASQHYGLTEGGQKSTSVSLTELGKTIAFPKNSQAEKQAHISAFLNVEIFRKVYAHYENHKLPEHKFLRNSLITEFKLNADFVDEFIELFEGNLRFLSVDFSVALSFDVVQGQLEQAEENGLSKGAVVRSGRKRAFVIMPFAEKTQERSIGFYREVFKSLIEPAGQAAGFDVEWANKAGSDVIQSTIINDVLDADLLIADLTDHNPNVLFELGMRLAFNKGPTALLKSQDTGRLFDVDNMLRVYEYKPTLWKTSLEIDIPNLEEHIRATWEGRENKNSYFDILRKRS